MNLLVLWATLFPLALSAPLSDDLIIALPSGQVQGTTYTTDTNKTFYGFQGIPYAKPPLDDLRFEAPQPAQPWEGVWNATKDRASCLSILHIIYGNAENEDCLYISVYTPSLKPPQKLPVMFWIHGGGFVFGSASKDLYGPDYIVEEDVIYVSANYRTGALGFLSTGDSAIPGNNGLKDQALAIKWTHDNVEYFGGDPEKITIFGQSAGGCSTGLHVVNSKAKGLFRAAIPQSGSAVTNFTIDLNPKAYADLLTSKLGGEMYLNDTQQMKNFLKSKTALELVTAQNLLSPKHEVSTDIKDLVPKHQPWPVIEVENEDSFLTESPYELLASGRFNQVPIMIGVCANEALYFLNDTDFATNLGLQYDTSPDSIIQGNLRQNSSDNDVIVKSIRNLYLKEEENFSSNLAALSNFGSDSMFVRGAMKHAELSAKYVPVYFYQFAYYGRIITPFVIPGAEKATHGSEIPFLTKHTSINAYTDSSDDQLTQNRVVKLWTNFAKYLNPTPEITELIDVTWPVITSEFKFLNINGTLEVRSPVRGSTHEGWNRIYDTYGKKPFITF